MKEVLEIGSGPQTKKEAKGKGIIALPWPPVFLVG
jgi:hypothetical protein